MRRISILMMGLLLVPLDVLAASPAPLYSVPAPNAEQLASGVAPQIGRYRIGVALPLALDSAVDGVWSEVGNQRIWEVQIDAPGALSLSLHFARAQLPAGAELVITGAEESKQGPYSAAHLRKGHLWTAMVLGERAQLRLTVPAHEQANLKLSEVHYGYRDPSGVQSKSGSCNIDVACSASNGHQDQVRSTVLLEIRDGNTIFACSGFLANNVRGDKKPYVLTANHCGITTSNDDSVKVYWKFQRSSCTNSGLIHSHGSPSPNMSVTGVQRLAGGPNADFTLFVLGTNSNPVMPPSGSDPYWSGWDATTTPAQSGVGVHHPNGDEKSISVFDSPVLGVTADIDGRAVKAWEVYWDQGTTEPGSSGSGLWNQSGRAVGFLSGGGASCSSTNSPDFYGRLSVAWTEQAANNGQLKFWLDPDNSGVKQLNGRGLTAPTPTPTARPTNSPSPTVAPTATPKPSGGSGAFQGLVWFLSAALLVNRRRRNFPLGA